jgi:nucleoside-diphosphate-sugar epimerase
MKTILVTGGTGFLGSWVTKQLLEKSYIVRLAVRNKNKTQNFAHLQAIQKQTSGILEIWEADLLTPNSYNAAAQGADAIIHMASPFTLRFKDPQTELIDPALHGTQNVLAAATASSTVKKVILTSSVAAVHGDNIDMKEQNILEFNESHFNTSSSVKHQPYSYSKVIAEKEAWKMAGAQNKWQLVVINPSFIIGPTLTNDSNSESLHFMKEMLGGKYFMGAPNLMFGFVDVRDVATAHILALETETAAGRHILAERTESVYNFAQIIKKLYGNKYKLPIMVSPKFMMYLVGWAFGLKNGFITRNVGYPIKLNTSKSKTVLGLKYTPIETTIKDMVTQMES